MSEYYLNFWECKKELSKRVLEPPPTRIQLLSGPRQVGKTTLLLDLAEEYATRAIYVAGDAPEASLPGFWERLSVQIETLASDKGGMALVLLDEIQHIDNWSIRLKAEWDKIKRKNLPVHVIATGSSSLHLGAGSRETLAGRFEKLTLAHWSANSLSQAFEIPVKEAAHLVVEIGTYPGAFNLRTNRMRWAAYVRDAIMEPAIGRDLLALGIIRRPALLRQIFAIAINSPAQIMSLKKLQGQLQDHGALETIAHYLELLEDAFLIASLEKFSIRSSRSRSSPPKLITLNNAFLAASNVENIPNATTDPARFGAWVENACLAHAWNAGQKVWYWREEPLEVDGVIEGSWGKWAVEIKTGSWGLKDITGLLEFTRRNQKYAPLILCDENMVPIAERAGVRGMSWIDFLGAGNP